MTQFKTFFLINFVSNLKNINFQMIVLAHLSSFARSSLSTAIPVGGHGEGERVDGVVGEGGGGEDDDVEVVEDDDRDDKEGGDGDEEDWVGAFLGGDGGCSSF